MGVDSTSRRNLHPLRALEDLEVNGMGINFKVLENERQIIMNMLARRQRISESILITSHDFWRLHNLFKWRENLNLPEINEKRKSLLLLNQLCRGIGFRLSYHL